MKQTRFALCEAKSPPFASEKTRFLSVEKEKKQKNRRDLDSEATANYVFAF